MEISDEVIADRVREGRTFTEISEELGVSVERTRDVVRKLLVAGTLQVSQPPPVSDPEGNTLRLILEVLRKHREEFPVDSKTVTITYEGQRIGTFTRDQLDARIEILKSELSQIWRRRVEGIKDQPPPVAGEGDMWRLVIDQLERTMTTRREFGLARYGQPVMAFTNRDPLIDMFQEDLDRIVYFQQFLYERQKLSDVAKKIAEDIRRFDKNTVEASIYIGRLVGEFLTQLGYGDIVRAAQEFDALEGE